MTTSSLHVCSRGLGALLAASALLLTGCGSDSTADAAAPDGSAGATTVAGEPEMDATTPAPSPVGDGAASPSATAPADNPASTPAPQTTAAPAAPAATVALAFAEWDAASGTVQAAGQVGSVIEDGGECTLTLTSGATTVTTGVDGFADATTTVCSGLAIDGDRLSSGTWTATLQYTPLRGTPGTSDPLDVVVP